jgi:hypothetical protein
MPYVGRRGVMETRALFEALLNVCRGQDASTAAQAALELCLTLWSVGGVTRDQALEVTRAQIEAAFEERSN